MSLRRGPTVKDMKLICDLIYDVASFAQPEVVTFPGVGSGIRMIASPGAYIVCVNIDRRWQLREVFVDEATGEPSELQPEPLPMPLTEPSDSLHQCAYSMIYYLVSRLNAAIEDRNSSKRDRSYAETALLHIVSRTQGSART